MALQFRERAHPGIAIRTAARCPSPTIQERNARSFGVWSPLQASGRLPLPRRLRPRLNDRLFKTFHHFNFECALDRACLVEIIRVIDRDIQEPGSGLFRDHHGIERKIAARVQRTDQAGPVFNRSTSLIRSSVFPALPGVFPDSPPGAAMHRAAPQRMDPAGDKN